MGTAEWRVSWSEAQPVERMASDDAVGGEDALQESTNGGNAAGDNDKDGWHEEGEGNLAFPARVGIGNGASGKRGDCNGDLWTHGMGSQHKDVGDESNGRDEEHGNELACSGAVKPGYRCCEAEGSRETDIGIRRLVADHFR